MEYTYRPLTYLAWVLAFIGVVHPDYAFLQIVLHGIMAYSFYVAFTLSIEIREQGLNSYFKHIHSTKKCCNEVHPLLTETNTAQEVFTYWATMCLPPIALLFYFDMYVVAGFYLLTSAWIHSVKICEHYWLDENVNNL